ncbi:Pycsar system effector family protein [Sediminibacter sp. Hel_I_10]|uniref:Pycsar system effector family protein n=1 Tax=Sediminibacter sp. Hel_I_10 TaxID=1392490 RepID=UPI00047E7FBD|nr:Pycsar system effector family protein [Sediminibacter sp. Hel_I_10]
MEKERLEYTVNRLDHYYDSVNNKTAVYIAINTFITGGTITLITQIQELPNQENYLLFFLAAIITLGVGSLILLALASMPYFSAKSEIESLYYFASIGQKEPDEFFDLSKNQTKKGNLKDLRNQVYILSKGLKSKFRKLKWACVLLIIQFMLLAPSTYILIKITS